MFIKRKAYKRQRDKRQWEEEGIEIDGRSETNEGGEVNERRTEGDNFG